MRWAWTLLVALAACAPPPDPNVPDGGNPCGCTALTITLPSADDMTFGYPAVNDAVRAPCAEAVQSITCRLGTAGRGTCEQKAAAALDALADQGIAGADASCFDECGCELL